ncbi:signal peptidase complex subunit 3 (SPCS3) [Vairimorpha necatrix]|uniref:Signal peptidase complex subunit 3 (SPCS3) n=1 Tax=Vairimorpha necatrix TaxID=6039 RepID=A0AAX4JA82_9MICR
MHLTKRRFTFCFSALFNPTLILLGLIFLCSLLVEKPPAQSDIIIKEIKASGLKRGIKFNPRIDLTDQFNFNVKIIFLYVRINYQTGSQEMIWSRIIRREDAKIINETLKNIYDIRGEVGTEVEIEVRGCVTPFVGLIRDKSYGTIKCVI